MAYRRLCNLVGDDGEFPVSYDVLLAIAKHHNIGRRMGRTNLSAS